MPDATFDLSTLSQLLVATLVGLAVGIEREWSGKASGPRARFAGVRTFTMLGAVSGLAGWLWGAGLQGIALVLLAGLSALVVVAYLAASRHDVDGTTEVAAFVVMAAGLLAGIGFDRVASGIAAVTVLLLFEKKVMHTVVSRLDRIELRAGVRFAVMAVVILPLLPVGPYGPWGGIRPRALWIIVLAFSAVSFVGYIAQRAAGRKGYAVAGTLGGLLSSTSVTLSMSRLSRRYEAAGRMLAAGVLGANVMLFPRVLAASAILESKVVAHLWPALVAPAVIGVALFLTGLRDHAPRQHAQLDRNPLQFLAALQMAAIFQGVFLIVWWARAKYGEPGTFTAAAILGLVDVDAVVVSMTSLAAAEPGAAQAAWGIVLAVLSNTLVKLGMTIVIGRGRFRPLAATGLALIAAALGVALWWTK